MRKILFIILILTLLATACNRNRGGEPVESGPKAFFRSDLARTGVFQSSAVKNPTNSKWEFQTGEWVDTAPIVVENSVYFGSYDGNVYAVDEENGTEIWRYETGQPVLSSPAVSGEYLYVGEMSGALSSLNRITGESHWRFGTQGSVLASPAVANELAYVGSEGGLMYAININNGQEAWHIEAGAPIVFPATVAEGLLVFGDMAGKLTAVQAINGEQVWQMQLTDGFTSSVPAIKDGVIYIAATDANQSASLYAVDITAQTIKWFYPLSAESYAAPAVWEELVFVADLGGMVTAVDQETGSVRWQFSTGDLTFSAPALTGDIVYFGSMDQTLYAVEAQTGNEIWRFPIGSGVSSPTIYDGVLYVGTQDGRVLAIPGSE